MIALICGKIAYKEITSVVIDANGVGYRVFIPLTTFYELPEAGESVTLHVHTSVKEDAINLFGFYTTQERDLFQLMISRERHRAEDCHEYYFRYYTPMICCKQLPGGNVGKLVGIPGVGRKMAERLILELKEKVVKKMTLEQLPVVGDRNKTGEMLREDVLSALVNLGYKNNTAKDALDKVMQMSEEELTLDSLLKRP